MPQILARMLGTIAVCLTVAVPAAAQGDTPAQQASRLVNQGNVQGAIQLLRDHLNKNAKDVEARVFFGQILDFEGRPDEAVTMWEQGLSGAASDFTFFMWIGEIRHRQGRDGPLISRRRGMVGAVPGTNKAEEERFQRSRLAQAATAYEKARKLRPDDEDAATALASVYSLQEKHDSASAIWKSLVALAPKNAEYQLQLALATKQAGRSDEAAQHLEQAIALDPRLAEAHQALAEYQKANGRASEAEQSQNRAEFYSRLPAFCKLVYSNENRKTLENLNQQATVRTLLADPSESAAEFLAVLCWTHPHNELETTAFEALDSRGASTTPLVGALLRAARSTCTIKSAAHILARRKADGLLDFLVKRLPDDIRGFAMDMDIAGALDDLSDARAVGPLVQMLNPGNANAAQQGGPLADRDSARRRAALALGAFDTPEARRALDQGTRSPEVATACLAALYRLSPDAGHLRAIEKAANQDQGFASYMVGTYLRNKVGTAEAKKLAQVWEQQREAKRAAAKAQAEENAPKKPDQSPE